MKKKSRLEQNIPISPIINFSFSLKLICFLLCLFNLVKSWIRGKKGRESTTRGQDGQKIEAKKKIFFLGLQMLKNVVKL